MTEPSIPLSELVGDESPRNCVRFLRDTASLFSQRNPRCARLARIADAIEAHTPAEPPEGTTHLIDRDGDVWDWRTDGRWRLVRHQLGYWRTYAHVVKYRGPVQHLRLLDGEDGSC